MNTAARYASEAIGQRRALLARALVTAEFERHPELAQLYGSAGRANWLHDAQTHLSYLAEALAFDNRALFIDYIAWSKVLLVRRGLPAAELAAQLASLAVVLRERLPAQAGTVAAQFVDAARQAMPAMPHDLPSDLDEETPMALLAHQYAMALLRGERDVASRLITEAVARGTSVGDIYLRVFQPAQHEVGRLWQRNDISAAREHYCTAATQVEMSRLYRHLRAGEKNGRTLVATCVGSDPHVLGGRMVADFFEMAGWNTFYLGACASPAAVIQTLLERKADMLAVSATMPCHLSEVRRLLEAVRERPDCRRTPVLVGGRAFAADPDLWRKVGADGTGRDAREAVLVAERIMAARHELCAAEVSQ